MERRTFSTSGSFSGGGLELGLGDSIKQDRRRQGTESETRLLAALAVGVCRLWNYGRPYRNVQSIPLAGYPESPGRADIRSLELPRRVPNIYSTLLLAYPGNGRHGAGQGRVFPDPRRSDVAAIVACQAASADIVIDGSLSHIPTAKHCGFC